MIWATGQISDPTQPISVSRSKKDDFNPNDRSGITFWGQSYLLSLFASRDSKKAVIQVNVSDS